MSGLTPYQQDRLNLYGVCWCNGVRTVAWNVERDDETLNVSMGLMCTRCGEGDPSYRPTD